MTLIKNLGCTNKMINNNDDDDEDDNDEKDNDDVIFKICFHRTFLNGVCLIFCCFLNNLVTNQA